VLAGSHRPKGRKTSLVRRYCHVYGLIFREVGCGYPGLRLLATFVALIPTASGIARLVTAHSEDTCFMRGQVVRKQPELGSENSFGPSCAPDYKKKTGISVKTRQ